MRNLSEVMEKAHELYLLPGVDAWPKLYYIIYIICIK